MAQFEAHPDYIRSIAVHPTRPYILTSSDDMTIKLWNWENNWKLEQIFEGHQHYVMSLAFNPKDLNTFASACLDRTVKIWSLGSNTPNFTLLAHETKGVNYVEYYPQSDKPYLITASDDRSIKVWDYQTKSCVATLEGHLSNVSFAVFHPELPLIISGSEDASIKIWNSNTYKLEKSLNYAMERAWCVATRKGSNLFAVGFDTGHVIVQLGDDKPLISMDPMGKVIWAKHTDIYSTVIKASDAKLDDGEILSLSQKELGNVENFPTSLEHSPNGRFVTVTGDGEYIIYTALAWRNKSYGTALDFVWSQDSNYYAVRETVSSIKIFKNFKEKSQGQIDLIYAADKIYGGTVLTVKSEGFISFYDWETGSLVRRVDVEAQDVIWSESGDLVLIASQEAAYVLRFDRDVFNANLEAGNIDEQEGCEEAFELLYNIEDSIVSGKWAGDVFIYTSSANRLNYLVGGSIFNIAHFDKNMYLLGYLPRDNKVYVADKDINIVSYHVALSVLEYQTVVLRGDIDQASELLENIDQSEMPKIARFLEQQGYKELALEITTDNEQKFELAIETLDLKTAYDIASKDINKNSHKWKQLGDIALANWDLKLASEAFKNSKDFESLLLLYTSFNDTNGLKELAESCVNAGKYNVAFSALWSANDVDGCIKLLQKTNRFTEASILSLSYKNDKTDLSENVKLWSDSLLSAGNKNLADRLTSPSTNPELFPSLNSVSESLIDIDNDVPAKEAVTEAAAAEDAEVEEAEEAEEAEEEEEAEAEEEEEPAAAEEEETEEAEEEA